MACFLGASFLGLAVDDVTAGFYVAVPGTVDTCRGSRFFPLPCASLFSSTTELESTGNQVSFGKSPKHLCHIAWRHTGNVVMHVMQTPNSLLARKHAWFHLAWSWTEQVNEAS